MTAAGACRLVYVPQGTYEISSDPAVRVTTVLGSCVSACVWDPVRQVGGMNHLLLPPPERDDGRGATRGVHLMELLINAVLKRGAEKRRLKVKLFGGARMIEGVTDIGRRNAAFARDFFAFEGLQIVAECLGGTAARRIQFAPATGQARQRLVDPDAIRAVPRARAPAVMAGGGEVDLF